MAETHGYFSDAVSMAWHNTWELVDGRPLLAIVIALIAFGVGYSLLCWRHGWKHESVYARIEEAVFGGIAIIIVGMVCFLVEILFIVPSQWHRQIKNLVRENANLVQTNASILTSDTKQIHFLQDSNDERQREINRLHDEQKSGGVSQESVLDEPIVSATATVIVNVEAPHPYAIGVNHTVGGGIYLLSDGKFLLSTTTQENTSFQTENGQGKYQLVASSPPYDVYMGKPIRSLLDAKQIQINFHKDLVPPHTKILSGQLIWVINNQVSLRFQIPPITTVDAGSSSAVLIDNISDGLKPLSGSMSPLAQELNEVKSQLEHQKSEFDNLKAHSLVSESYVDPDEWPSLTDNQIKEWTATLAPFHIHLIEFYFTVDADAKPLYESFKTLGKELQCQVDGQPTSYSPTGNRIENIVVNTYKNAALGSSLVGLFTGSKYTAILKDDLAGGLNGANSNDVYIFIGAKQSTPPSSTPDKSTSQP